MSSDPTFLGAFHGDQTVSLLAKISEQLDWLIVLNTLILHNTYKGTVTPGIETTINDAKAERDRILQALVHPAS